MEAIKTLSKFTGLFVVLVVAIFVIAVVRAEHRDSIIVGELKKAVDAEIISIRSHEDQVKVLEYMEEHGVLIDEKVEELIFGENFVPRQ